MVSRSTIIIFVLVFAVLGLLLGFAESYKVDDASTGVGLSSSFSRIKVDPGSLEIDPIDTKDDSSN